MTTATVNFQIQIDVDSQTLEAVLEALHTVKEELQGLEALTNRVHDEMIKDIKNGDSTVLFELLRAQTVDTLKGMLPE
jgi:hypothetical protein